MDPMGSGLGRSLACLNCYLFLGVKFHLVSGLSHLTVQGKGGRSRMRQETNIAKHATRKKNSLKNALL